MYALARVVFLQMHIAIGVTISIILVVLVAAVVSVLLYAIFIGVRISPHHGNYTPARLVGGHTSVHPSVEYNRYIQLRAVVKRVGKIDHWLMEQLSIPYTSKTDPFIRNPMAAEEVLARYVSDVPTAQKQFIRYVNTPKRIRRTYAVTHNTKDHTLLLTDVRTQAVIDRIYIPKWIRAKYMDTFITDIDRAYVLMRRYLTYTQCTGSGFQLALPTDIYQVLRDTYEAKLECFASPFNHYLDTYCSAFPDIDTWYGSLGSFFDVYKTYDFTGAAHVANPPYQEEVMQRTIEVIESILSTKTSTFFISVPKWDDASAILMADRSPYLIHRYDLIGNKSSLFVNYTLTDDVTTTVYPADTYLYVLSTDRSIDLTTLSRMIHQKYANNYRT